MARQDQSSLSAAQRKAFVDALIKLKADGGSKNYDYYVQVHIEYFARQSPNAHHAHNHASFLPWHRYMLKEFEERIGLEIPYWDWPKDTTKIFGTDFLGSSKFFSRDTWPIRRGVELGPVLRRGFQPGGNWPTSSALDGILGQQTYARFRSALENGPHGYVHNQVAGSNGHMGNGSSPNDPVFWLHHCMVDKMWHDWQRKHPGTGSASGEYFPLGQGSGQELGLDSNMLPWNSTPKAMLPFRPYPASTSRTGDH